MAAYLSIGMAFGWRVGAMLRLRGVVAAGKTVVELGWKRRIAMELCCNQGWNPELYVSKVRLLLIPPVLQQGGSCLRNGQRIVRH